jgi:hypothetical protein
MPASLRRLLFSVEMEDRVRRVLPIQEVRVHGPEVHAIFSQLVSNPMNMAIPALAQISAHVAIKLQLLR